MIKSIINRAQKILGMFMWRMSIRRCLLPIFFLIGSTASHAGYVLDEIKARDFVRCGVSEGIAGFSTQDAQENWKGFEVDFCRAVAAAILNDPQKVKFISLKASERFPQLKSKQIDLLMRNTTWTLLREATLGVRFPVILFYDYQTVLVPVQSDIKTIEQLNQKTVCVEKGSNSLDNLTAYLAQKNIHVTPLVIDSALAAEKALFEGKCQAYTSDRSLLAAARLDAKSPDDYMLLPDIISKEPLGPVINNDDEQWETVVRWVFFALVTAEELNVNQKNIDKIKAEKKTVRWPHDELRDNSMGLSPDWAERIVRAVGNYGDMYERNVGMNTPLKLERGENNVWTQGGLLYAPPPR